MIDTILNEYKKVTEEILMNIKNDLITDGLMDKREELLKELFKDRNVSVGNIKELYLSKGLLELDKKLEVAIKEESLKIKEEIKYLHKIKSANNCYGNNKRSNNFFSVKI